MLPLGKYTDFQIDPYYKRISSKVEEARDNSPISQTAKDYLTKKKIREIIYGQPGNLKNFHDTIIPMLNNAFTLAEYQEYTRVKKVRNKNANQEQLVAKYNSVIQDLSNIFNYKRFISESKSTSYLLAKIHSRNTCTYCNRLYTNLIETEDPETGNINDSTRIARPHFDHWFPKNVYPILSLSFYNLIPSCYVCNSSIKGDTEFSLESHLHPFVDMGLEKFTFNYRKENVYENNVILNYRHGSKMERTLKDFYTKEVYNAHSEFELKDLLELRYKYPENYLNTLFNKTFDVSIGKLEIYRMIFGTEYKDSEFHKRPFSKFKKDILKELGIKLD